MTDAEILAAVHERLDLAHMDTIAIRRRLSRHTYTSVHRRYWDERIALDSLLPGMTLAELLASEHWLVREAALVVLGAAPADVPGVGPHRAAGMPAPRT